MQSSKGASINYVRRYEEGSLRFYNSRFSAYVLLMNAPKPKPNIKSERILACFSFAIAILTALNLMISRQGKCVKYYPVWHN